MAKEIPSEEILLPSMQAYPLKEYALAFFLKKIKNLHTTDSLLVNHTIDEMLCTKPAKSQDSTPRKNQVQVASIDN